MTSYNSILRYFFPLLFFLQYNGCDTYRWLTNSYEPKRTSEVVKNDCTEVDKYEYNGLYAPSERGKLFVKKDQYTKDDSLMVSSEAIIGIADIKSVNKSYDTMGNPSILMTFTEEGKQSFKAYTANNISGKVAIIIKNELITAPVINAAIPGGEVEVSGNFTQKEADALYTHVYKMIQCIDRTD